MYPLLLGTAHHVSTQRHETNLHCRPYLPKVEKEPLEGDQTTGPWHCKHGPMVSWPSIERVAATLPTFRRGGGGSKCSGLPPLPLRWTLQSLPQLPGARICGSTQQCGRWHSLSSSWCSSRRYPTPSSIDSWSQWASGEVPRCA